MNYDGMGDAIVILRKQGQFIKKNTWRAHSQFLLSQGLPRTPREMPLSYYLTGVGQELSYWG